MRSTQTDILLDAGTNELEILVFAMDGGRYGVNVAKVREVIRLTPPTESPMRHPSVMGMINLRGQVVPLIDLRTHLGLGQVNPCNEHVRVIVMEFNGLRSGYVVDSVDQIHRVTWQAVRQAPDVHTIDTSKRDAGAVDISTCTGILDLDGSLVLMLDFESVADAILLDDKLRLERVDNPDNVDRGSKRVVLAEDSPFMRELMRKVLINSGYTRLEAFANGADAWDAIEASSIGGIVADPVHAVVSDIEMPQMDGLHLCKRIREHGSFTDLPVVLFSSLISEDNKKKGRQVGASAQIAKPELEEMVRLVDLASTGRLLPEGETAGNAIRDAA
ncbi:MAG: chemotaxis protein [Planctomycetota bacterium]